MTINNNNQFNDSNKNIAPEVDNELSKVAANPKQSALILILVTLVFIFIIYKIFFVKSEVEVSKIPSPPISVQKPITESNLNTTEIPKLPEVPKLQIPANLTPPPPPKQIDPNNKINLPKKDNVPVPPLNIPTISNDKIVRNEDEQRRIDARRKSPIALISGVPKGKSTSEISEESAFIPRGDMRFVLAKGKIIEAVLESAINTDFGGEIRAMVSRDVFSEQGQIVLIPKGSKIFGTYNTGTDGPYGRISIIWHRIDLSNGYSLNLESLSIDNLGRPGSEGVVDNKFKERLTNAVLMSAFNIGIAHGLDKIVKPTINSQSATTNTTIATNIQSLAQNINTAGGDENFKISQLCSTVQNAIIDKTSPAFTMILQACSTAQTSVSATPGQRLNILITAVNSAAASLLTNTATATTPTQAQLASKQAFTDITNTMKSFIEQQKFAPTITIDQGSIIKIYVKKDYKFPERILYKTKLVN